MANVFDRFDASPGGSVAVPRTKNPFDAFDDTPPPKVKTDKRFPYSADNPPPRRNHKIGPKPEPGMPGATTITGIGGDMADPKRKKELDQMFGPATDKSTWDKRADGTTKGTGFLGVLTRPDGNISSEISVGVNMGGKETDIPLLVPTLSKDEVTAILTLDPKDKDFFKKLPAGTIEKARAHAEKRMAEGKNVFADDSESPQTNAFDQFDTKPPKGEADAGYLSEFGKAGVRGAGQIIGSTGKGLSVLTTSDAAKVKAVEDGIASLGSMTDEQANEFLRSIPANMDIFPAAALNYQMAVRALYRGDKAKADEYLKTARSYVETRPVEEQSFYKASDEFSKQFDSPDWKPSPGWEDSWTSALGNALGTTAALGGVGVLSGGPGVALVGGAAQTDQQRQMAQKELEKFKAGQGPANSPFIGKTPEEAKLMVDREAKLGFIPGASEQAPIEMLIIQAGRITPGLRKFMATEAGRTWVQRAGRILRQSAAEGGQEGLQQVGSNLIHQFMTNPEMDITEGVADNMLIGALVGGGMSGGIEAVDAALPAPKAPVEPSSEAPPAPPVEPRLVPPQQGSGLPSVDLPPTPPGYTGPTEDVAPAAPAVGQAPKAPVQFKRPVASPQGQQTPSNVFDKFDAPAEESGKQAEIMPEIIPAPGEAPLAPVRDGSRKAPIKAQTATELAPAREQVNTEPSEAQAKAGNYSKGHVKVHGLDITIENPRGSTRKGVDADGTPWETTQPVDYGYFKRTVGNDSDQVDVYLGPDLEAPSAFVIDQIDLKTGQFDESKSVLGARSKEDARRMYSDSFSDGKGPDRIGHMTEMPIEEFRSWLKNSGGKKPLGPAPQATEIAVPTPAETPPATAPKSEMSIAQHKASLLGAAQKGSVVRAKPGFPNAEQAIADLVKEGKLVPDTRQPKGYGYTTPEALRPDESAHATTPNVTKAPVKPSDTNIRAAGGAPLVTPVRAHMRAGIGDQMLTNQPSAKQQEEYAANLEAAQKREPLPYPSRADAMVAKKLIAKRPSDGAYVTRPAGREHLAAYEAQTPKVAPPSAPRKEAAESEAPAPKVEAEVKVPAVVEDKGLYVQFGKKRFPMESYEQASKALRGMLDETGGTFSGETGPKVDTPLIVNAKGETVAYISQNGRVWAGKPADWKDGAKPLYDPIKLDKLPEPSVADRPVADQQPTSETPPINRPEKGSKKPPKAKDEGVKLFNAPSAEKTETPAFKAWFKDSKVVDENGKPKVVYHGAQRGDRIGNRFRKSRATSGPMPFFTDDTEIASNYAASKPDTSFDRPASYAEWIKFKPEGSRTEVDIERAWHFLTPEQRKEIAEKLPHVVNVTPDGDEARVLVNDEYQTQYRLGDRTEWGLAGKSHWDHVINQESRGNILKAAVSVWLDSGALFNSEEEFMEVLRLGGVPMKQTRYADPNVTSSTVFPVYLSIQKPLVTNEVSQETVDALDAASKRTRTKARDMGEVWHKLGRDPKEWMAELRDAVAKAENSHVWTSIPDWVTSALKAMGFDGIQDTGGKNGGKGHNVWIPFEENQVKSATGNRGTFDPKNKSILANAPSQGLTSTSGFFTGPSRAELTELQEKIDKIGDRILGHRIKWKMIEYIPDREGNPSRMKAAFDPNTNMIELALTRAQDFIESFGHEALHALRELGVITADEWKLLKGEVKRATLEGRPIMDEIRDRYEEMYRESMDITPEQLEDLLVEEAVANMIGAHVAGTIKVRTGVARLIDKIHQFLEAMINAAKGYGFRTGRGVTKDILSGKMSQRPTSEGEGRGYGLRRRQNAPKPYAENPTAAPAFMDWFGDSKIVDRNGKPLVVYHGSGQDFESFRAGGEFKGGAGIYFTKDAGLASRYARGQGAVYPVYLSIENPLIISKPSFWTALRAKPSKTEAVSQYVTPEEMKQYIADGYDGIINEDANEFVVFSPNQVKSVNNRGAWDKTDDRILFSAPSEPAPDPSDMGKDEESKEALEDLAGNINLHYLLAPEDIKKALRDVSEKAKGFIDERRGVQTNEMTRQLAKEMGMKPSELLERKTGVAFNAEEIFAARVMMMKSIKRLAAMASQAAKSQSLADAAEFMKAYTRHVAIQEQIAGMTAEAGRALQQFKMMAGDSYFQAAEKIIDAAKSKDKNRPLGAKNKLGPEAAIDLAQMIDALNDPAKISKFTREAFKVTIFDMIREFWINALLSGPRTHVTNILSNTITALWQVPETAVASTIGLLHGGEKVKAMEATARLTGLIEGTKDGMVAAWATIKSGEPMDLMSKLENHRKKAIPGVLGAIVRTPGTLLQAEDEVFKAMNYRAELHALATRLALREGNRGKSLAARVNALVQNPPASMKKAANEAALYNTFQTKLGPIGSYVMGLREKIPGAYLIAPFIRTPANIIKYAAERTPLGLAMKGVRENLSGKNGNVARDTQIARMALGSAIAAVIASYVLAGVISGAGPDDPDERNVLRAAGWQPYSVKIGGTWYSYQRFDPFALIVGVTADMVELGEAVREADGGKIGAMIISSISGNLLDKTWLSGPSNFISAIQDPQRYGDSYVRRFAGSLVPAIVNQTNQAFFDPVVRDARTMLDEIKARLPYFSQSLPPRRNIFGEEIRREGALGPDILSSIFMSADKENQIAKEMVKLDYFPSMPRREINGNPLTPEQYDKYTEIAGKKAVKDLERKVAMPAWQKRQPDDNIKIISKAYEDAREYARNQMKRQYPELRKKPK